jgi:hypothetical protein
MCLRHRIQNWTSRLLFAFANTLPEHYPGSKHCKFLEMGEIWTRTLLQLKVILKKTQLSQWYSGVCSHAKFLPRQKRAIQDFLQKETNNARILDRLSDMSDISSWLIMDSFLLERLWENGFIELEKGTFCTQENKRQVFLQYWEVSVFTRSFTK